MCVCHSEVWEDFYAEDLKTSSLIPVVTYLFGLSITPEAWSPRQVFWTSFVYYLCVLVSMLTDLVCVFHVFVLYA